MEDEGFRILDFPINTGFTYGGLMYVREILRVEHEKTGEEKLSKIIDSIDNALNNVEGYFKEKK